MRVAALASVSRRYGPRAVARKLTAAAIALLLAASPAVAEPVIAALGDSLTRGQGLPADEGFVPRMQAWLAAHGTEAEIRNAGVSGDTTADGLARVDWTLSDDVDAMIVALGGNDLLRGIAPATAKANLRGILEKAQAADVAVLLVGMRAPGNYGPDYKRAFDAIYPALAERYDTLYADDFLGAIDDPDDRAEAARKYMQPDGIHPSAAGVKRIVADLGPDVMALVERVREDGAAR